MEASLSSGVSRFLFMVLNVLVVVNSLLLAFVVVDTNAALCTAKFPLTLNFLNKTTLAGNPSTCADGTPVAYLIDLPDASVPRPYKWIIYLSDGETCDEAECDTLCDLDVNKKGGICEGIKEDLDDVINNQQEGIDEKLIRCYFARLQCGSSFAKTSTTIVPQTILCRENSYFGGFARVFLQSCSLDWFLGRGSVKNVTSTRFRGAYVLDQLIETLDKVYGMTNSPLVVLTGSRGGGVGALHSVKYVRQKLNGNNNVIVIADSAWFLDTEGFAPKTNKPQDVFVVDGKLQKDTKEWIEFARLNEDCDLLWNVGGPGVANRHRCLIVPELLPFLLSERIMFIHSQYDLFFLSTMGLLDENAEDRFFDTQSYALRAISYIESFGSIVRSSTLDAATIGPDNHYFYMPSCGTHSFLIPTSLHLVDPQTREIGDAGSIRLRRDIKTWETIKVGDLTVETAVGEWIAQQGNAPVFPIPSDAVGEGRSISLVQDSCKGFLCNPTCTEEILPFRVRSVFSPCAQNVILSYAILMMVTLWLAFAWGYVRVHLFRYRARAYWHAFKTGLPLPDFGHSKRKEQMLNSDVYRDILEESKMSTKPSAEAGASSVTSGLNESSSNPVYTQQLKKSSLPMIPGSPDMSLSPASTPSFQSSPASSSPLPTFAATTPPAVTSAQVEPGDEEDEIDLIALAEALTSKDKATRLAAKRAYKEHQKRAADRRKQAQKSSEQREREKREKEARKQFEERQAAQGLATQQVKQAEEEAKKKKTEQKLKKKDAKAEHAVSNEEAQVELGNVTNPIEEFSTKPSVIVNAGKIQKAAEDELLMEAACLDYRKVHLMVRDLSYWAPPRKNPSIIKRLFTRNSSSKYQILRNVDLAVKPGNVHALMGPSGSGKSTLLDVLALIRDSGEMRGAHYINGVHSHTAQASFLRDWLRHNVSYVRQMDVLFPRMTVREHLQHAAWLLLPQFMPDAKKLRRVQQVIELLELDSCSDTVCGDGGIKIEGGISGGQRRRVSVATQLLRLPACILLDEPTSGLDSTNALLLVKSLHTLAHRGGLTVVMTIHQPRNEIFNLFDQLTILVGGRIVFSGLPNEAPKHFSLDAAERQDLSVANAILDKLAEASEGEVKGYEALYATGPLGKRVAEEMKAEATDFDYEMALDLQEVLRESALGEGRWSWESPSSSAMQMWVLMSRTMRRGGFDLRKSMLLSAIGGCVVGLCFLGVDSVTSRTALCYLCVATMTFLQGAFLGDRYLAEKQMYDHESAAGSAVEWTAFLASQFVRDSVTSASEAISFGIPAYWIGGMFPSAQRFIIFLILVVLIAHVCISSNVMVEIDRDNLRAAALVNVAYVGLGALFNGFIIRIKDLPIYLSWLPYIMVTYWGFAGILVNDFTGDVFGCKSSVLECATRTGDVVIVAFDFQGVDAYVTMLACIIMAILFRSCSVVDFFLRYVRGRGSGMKLLSGGSTLEIDQEKMQQRKQVFANSATRLGGAMKAMISNRGDAGKRMVENAKKKHQDDTQRVMNAGGGSGIAFNEEWDQVAEEGTTGKANAFRVAAKEPFHRRIFLSRMTMIAFCIFDIGFLGIVCAITVGASQIYFFYLALTSLVGIFFLIQFVMSLCYLVPITPVGPKDCTWAGANDAVAAACTLADIVILIQMWTSNAFSTAITPAAQEVQAVTFLILSGLCRLFRLIRVYNFWWKVSRYHELRAVSWLLFADQAKEKKMIELQAKVTGTGGAPGDSASKSRTSNRSAERTSNRFMAKSVRLAANPMWSSYAATPDNRILAEPPKIDPSTF